MAHYQLFTYTLYHRPNMTNYDNFLFAVLNFYKFIIS